MTTINTKTTGKKVPAKKIKKEEVKNKYKVPVRLWKSFGILGQKVFNETFQVTFDMTHQTNMTHPKQIKLPKEQWKTLCWNFSCHAAWSTKNLS
jgi:hypothetical protein